MFMTIFTLPDTGFSSHQFVLYVVVGFIGVGFTWLRDFVWVVCVVCCWCCCWSCYLILCSRFGRLICMWFLAHPSWRLGSFSDQNLSVVRRYRRRCRSCRKLFTFSSSSPTTGPISTNHDTRLPWVKGIQVSSNEGPRPFPRGDNYEIAKMHWRN